MIAHLNRIRFGTRQVVVFRYDLANKLRRHCLIKPAGEDIQLEEHVRGKALYWHVNRHIRLNY